MVSNSVPFKFHPKYVNSKLTHLFFADELMVFLGADVQPLGLIHDVLVLQEAFRTECQFIEE